MYKELKKALEMANLKLEKKKQFFNIKSKHSNQILLNGLLVNNSNPLSKEEVKALYQQLLLTFPNTYAFGIFATGGFEKKAYALEAFNIILMDDNFIKELHTHKEDYIFLLPHNYVALKKSIKRFKESKKNIHCASNWYW